MAASPNRSNGINNIRDNILLCTAHDGVRLYVLQQVKKATKACGYLTDQTHPEAMHDFRVAVRRLRAWIRAFKRYHNANRKLRKELGELTDSTNRCRDLEVCITWLKAYLDMSNMQSNDKAELKLLVDHIAGEYELALAEIKSRVPKAWDKLKGKIIKRINSDIKEDYIEDRLPDVAAEKLIEICKSINDNLALIRGIDDRVATHKTRIYFKRLRYLIEPLSGQASTLPGIIEFLKMIQDILGDYRDAHILIELIGKYRETAADASDHIFSGGKDHGIMFDKLIKHARRQELDKFNQFRKLYTDGDIQHVLAEVHDIGQELRNLQD